MLPSDFVADHPHAHLSPSPVGVASKKPENTIMNAICMMQISIRFEYKQIRGTWDEPQQIVVQDYSHAYSTRIRLSRLQTISVSRPSHSYDRS